MKAIDIRREQILAMVNEQGTVEFSQLREAFPGVSDVTLRKDLQHLNDTQQAIRTHGGIKSMPSALNYFYRSNVNQDKKKIIAAKAAAMIQPGESVFISAGTTCAAMAQCLPSFPLKVVSDGVYTVTNISTLPNISVELMGGEVDLNTMRVEGLSVLSRLDQLHFSTAFMGAMNVNPDYAFAHGSAMTAAILSKVIEQSDKVVVLMDSAKISTAFPPYSIPLNAVDVLVTDDDFPEDAAEKLRAQGIEIM